MRKLLRIVGGGVGLLALEHTSVHACGDKLLSLVTGVRAQRAFAATRPASILLYLGRNSNAKTIGEPQLQSTLKLAGHRFQVVHDANQAEQLLRSGHFDLVLADVSEAASLGQQAKSAPSQPTVMPVMYKPTTQERAAAEKQFGLVLSAPGKSFQYLVAIDEAMKRRAAAVHT